MSKKAVAVSGDEQPVFTGGYREDGEVTTHIAYDKGGGVAVVTGPKAHEPAPGETVITKADYTARLAELEAAHHAYLGDLEEEDRARTLADYRALRAAGIPDATARRLAGYGGPAE